MNSYRWFGQRSSPQEGSICSKTCRKRRYQPGEARAKSCLVRGNLQARRSSRVFEDPKRVWLECGKERAGLSGAEHAVQISLGKSACCSKCPGKQRRGVMRSDVCSVHMKFSKTVVTAEIERRGRILAVFRKNQQGLLR